VFLWLAVAGVVAGLALAGYTAYQAVIDPHAPSGIRVALVVLVLLNARQNLRQYRFAGILAKTGLGGTASTGC